MSLTRIVDEAADGNRLIHPRRRAVRFWALAGAVVIVPLLLDPWNTAGVYYPSMTRHLPGGARGGRGAALGESGYTLIELLIGTILMGILILFTLPGLTGYRGTSAMRGAARQAVTDLRGAQQSAVSQDAQTDLIFTVASGAVTGYTIQQGAAVLWQTAIPSGVRATTTWPGNDITWTPIGSVSATGTPPPALCLDNQGGLTISIAVTPATGSVQMTQGTGSC